jgi:general secretion pathway protein F
MGAFEYQALDDSGRTRRGISEGDSPRHVRDQLREQGLMPLEVRPVDGEAPLRGGRRAGASLPGAERALVLRQLATLVRAGLPLEEALGTVAEQATRKGTSAVFSALRASVREGLDLAEAMRNYPRAFSAEVVAAIAAGERSGALGAVLERLAGFAERRQGLGREMLLSLLYPVIVVAVALVVIAAMMTTVVPRVMRVFEHADRELPWLTRALISVSEFLSAHGFWALLAGVGVAVLVAFSLKSEGARAAWQGLLLRVPFLGRAMRAAATARFCRSLALQVASDVPLVEGLQVSAGATGLVGMSRQIHATARSVREGASFAGALGSEAVLPPLVTRLLASGEQTGKLAEMLDRAAQSQEEEAGMLSRTFSTLLQPVMILLVGLFVLLIVLAVMLPILELNQLLG